MDQRTHAQTHVHVMCICHTGLWSGVHAHLTHKAGGEASHPAVRTMVSRTWFHRTTVGKQAGCKASCRLTLTMNSSMAERDTTTTWSLGSTHPLPSASCTASSMSDSPALSSKVRLGTRERG